MFLKRELLIVLVYFSLGLAVHAEEVNDKHSSLGTVPLIISEKMKRVGCSPVRNFYESYMITEPPFIWLDNSGFVFVCERKGADLSIKYELVVESSSKQNHFKSCSTKINLFGKPGGLTLETRIVERDDFMSIDGRSELKSSPNKKLLILVLSTGTGGYIEYVCVSGSWYFNTYS